MKIRPIVILLATLVTQKGLGQSGPDLAKENMFYQIYSKYNIHPLSEEKWAQYISKRSELYSVQPGDNLWSISQTFFGDPSVWPKIWSVNSDDIFNPHEITPGQQIRFIAGSVDQAPRIELTNSLNADKGQLSHPMASIDPSENTQALIPPEKTKKPLLDKIPNSLPKYTYTNLPNPNDVTLEINEHSQSVASKYLINFLSEGDIQSVGKVVETEMGVQSAAEYQYIYVQLEDSSSGSDSNRIYTVAREIYDFSNNQLPFNFNNLKVNEIQGEIKILEKVNDNNTYRAIVLKNIGLLQVGSVLVPGPIPEFNLNLTSVTSIKGGQIIGGQDSGGQRKLLGNEEMVFLNVGSNDGASEGQTVEVYGNLRMRKSDTIAIHNDRAIGLIKIVKVTSNFSTGIIIKTFEDIVVGDLVGTRISPEVEIK